MKRASCLLMVLMLAVGGGCLSALAQSEESSADACVKTFDIEKALSSSVFQDLVRNQDPNLFEYLYCRGALEENFLSSVRALNWIRTSTYGDMGGRFDWYVFWIGLARAKTITPKMLTDCARVNETDQGTCKALLDAFMAKDASACDKLTKPGTVQHAKCRAEVLRDPTVLDGTGVTPTIVDNMYLLKAVSERNVAVCENIKRPLVKMMCRAACFGTVSECEKYDNFAFFKRKFCDTSR